MTEEEWQEALTLEIVRRRYGDARLLPGFLRLVNLLLTNGLLTQAQYEFVLEAARDEAEETYDFIADQETRADARRAAFNFIDDLMEKARQQASEEADATWGLIPKGIGE